MSEIGRAVLSGLLFQPEFFEKAEIKREFFGSERERKIFTAAKSQFEKTFCIDAALLASEVGGDGVGVFIGSLLDGTFKISAASFVERIKKLKEEFFSRRLQRCAEDMRLKRLDYNEAAQKIGKDFEEYSSDEKSGGLNLIPLSSIEPQAVSWLWPGRFPLGKLSLLVGDPGIGKSFFSIYLASIVTQGWVWPDCLEPAKPGSVLLFSAEDGLGDTIRVRGDAHGADCSKIHIFEGDPFSLQVDLMRLERTIKNIPDLNLIIFDPVSCYLGEGADGNKNEQVRALLAPVAKLAEKFNVCVLLISHLRKAEALQAIHRVTGSLAFTAAARAVWCIIRDPEDENRNPRRLLLPLKMSLIPEPSVLAFRLFDGQVIIEKTDGEKFDVNALVSPAAEKPGEQSEVKAACEWLKDVLSAGPLSSADVSRLRKEEGFSFATLRRAAERMKISHYREGLSGGSGRWFWRLP